MATFRLRLAAAAVLLSFAASRSGAQDPAAATSAQKGRPLTLAEYGRWNRIGGTALSNDGKWITYGHQPNDGDGTLFVKGLDSKTVYTINVGSAPAAGGGGGGGGAQFSDDSRWIGYFVNPPERAGGAAGGGRGGRGGGAPAPAPGGGRGAPPAAGAQGAAAATRRFELLNLATGEKTPIANAQSFRFVKGSKWLAVKMNKAQADAKHNGTDLVLRELATGLSRNIGNVGQFDFDDAGQLMAYTVDAADKNGNGVYLLNPSSGETRALASAAADFDQLAWSDERNALAVLRGNKNTEMKQRDNVLLAWSDVADRNAAALEYDPARAAGFPSGFVVSEYTAPRWSKDRARLFVGIKEQEPEVSAADSNKANVDVFHYKDAELQTVQLVRLAQERRATYPSVITVATKGFVRLGDPAMRSVTNTANGKWAVGQLDAPYKGEVQWGGTKADLIRVNVATGERTVIDKALTRTYGTSPDSRWFLYVKDKHVKAFDLENAKAVDIDAIAGGRSFIDSDDDHPYEKPIWGVGGWVKGGNAVLLYDKFDIWQIPLTGGSAVNLTNGIGKAQNIQFRVVRFGAGGGRGGRGGRGGGAAGGDDEGVDLSKPLTLSAYGDLTKKSGYWTVSAGQAPKPLIWADKSIGGVQKAEGADRVVFTQQSFTEFPDLWTSKSDFAEPTKVSDANPQIAEYAWGRRILVDYVNSKGRKMQATVTLPAGYVPGKRYPTIVYFYEIQSNTHHTFSQPVYDDRPHFSTYASNGYLIVQPDIVYEIGKPGSSALDCVTSAVKKVIELGYADPKHIGMQGHSWGGYETSYILTQTNMFAATVTGAPPANLVSMYDQLYKQTGTAHHGIMEIGQVRMGEGVTPWTAHELYESQSPVHNVRNIKTPFLILQGTDDGAVDWLQGMEWFNAAQRWGKEVIFLSYPGEPHHLAKKENQKDFQIRMKQYFDHYLMDAPAPLWMTNGVPATKKGGPIR